jgi:hypothetical protein
MMAGGKITKSQCKANARRTYFPTPEEKARDARRTVYYAHCMALYDTAQEKRDVELLGRLGWEVRNPNCIVDQVGAKTKGMEYFKSVVQRCDLFAFRALPDGAIPSGVYLELQWAREANIPVIELPSSVLRRGIDREQTREYIREVGKW